MDEFRVLAEKSGPYPSTIFGVSDPADVKDAAETLASALLEVAIIDSDSEQAETEEDASDDEDDEDEDSTSSRQNN